MEEIKKYITSSHDSDISTQNDTEFSINNTNDTLTLTKIRKEEKKIINNSNLDNIKNELREIKSAIYDNKDLLKKILLKIK